MKIREALILQSPSLALMRAAADEISKQDSLIAELKEQIQELESRVLVGDGSHKYFIPVRMLSFFNSLMENEMWDEIDDTFTKYRLG